MYYVKKERQVYGEIDRVRAYYKRQINQMIDALAIDPYPPKCKELFDTYEGMNFYRIWVHKWRIIYHVDEEEKVVTIKRVAKKWPSTYKGLK
jgi:mRNA-degrading endonuclease RelE of RelBE toxin-antitoxin system